MDNLTFFTQSQIFVQTKLFYTLENLTWNLRIRPWKRKIILKNHHLYHFEVLCLHLRGVYHQQTPQQNNCSFTGVAIKEVTASSGATSPGGPDQVRSFQFRMIELQENENAVPGWTFFVSQAITIWTFFFKVYTMIFLYWWCLWWYVTRFCWISVLDLEQHKQWRQEVFWWYVWRLTIMLCYLFIPLTFWTFF